MYRAILEALPVHVAFKVILVILVLVGVTAFCFLYAFPIVVEYIPYPFGNAGFDGGVSQ